MFKLHPLRNANTVSFLHFYNNHCRDTAFTAITPRENIGKIADTVSGVKKLPAVVKNSSCGTRLIVE